MAVARADLTPSKAAGLSPPRRGYLAVGGRGAGGFLLIGIGSGAGGFLLMMGFGSGAGGFVLIGLGAGGVHVLPVVQSTRLGGGGLHGTPWGQAREL